MPAEYVGARRRRRVEEGAMATFSFAHDVSGSGASFSAQLLPSEARALHEALSYCARTEADDAYLNLLLGAGQDVVDALLTRLCGPHAGPFDIRLRPDELHMLLCALTNAATHFVQAGGEFCQESFHIRLGHFRQDFDALALAINNAAYVAYETPTTHVTHAVAE
jgi:hypothetical protein